MQARLSNDTVLAAMPALDEAFSKFLTGPNALLIGTRDRVNVPAISRPAGCEVSADGMQVVLYLLDDPDDRCIPNIRETGAIALVVARPTTYETYQLKGTDAQLAPIVEEDVGRIAHYRASVVQEMTQVGLTRDLAGEVVPHLHTSMLKVTFSPSEVYRQTPGPGAGERREG